MMSPLGVLEHRLWPFHNRWLVPLGRVPCTKTNFLGALVAARLGTPLAPAVIIAGKLQGNQSSLFIVEGALAS